nr:reverse transcriptase domain-containing protein [Tanacetum cinerariifolium]
KKEGNKQQSVKQEARQRWKNIVTLEYATQASKPRDLVYQNNDASHAKDSGKLSPKWEEPCEVTKALGKGSYKLRNYNGKLLPRT